MIVVNINSFFKSTNFQLVVLDKNDRWVDVSIILSKTTYE